MSKNLNALLRYQTIDACLRSSKKEKWSWKDLAKACGERLYEVRNIESIPSRRTILGDIKVMRSGDLKYYAPIDWTSKRGYHYTDANFSIYSYGLSELEKEEFNKGVEILNQIVNRLGMDEVKQIISKLSHIINTSKQSKVPVIQFDQWIHEKGYQWLNLIYGCIKEKKALFISYRPFGGHAGFSGIVSPYLLKEYRNRWYLIAKFHNNGLIYHYALDRLRSTQESLQPFSEDSSFDAAKYFNQVIGITIPENGMVEQVQFRATTLQADYIKSKPLHATQVVLSEDDKGAVFQVEVIINYELEANLLSFGERVEVLAPATLREKMSKRIAVMIGLYNDHT